MGLRHPVAHGRLESKEEEVQRVVLGVECRVEGCRVEGSRN